MSQPSSCQQFDDHLIVAIGSNVTSTYGGPRQTVQAAVDELDRAPFKLLKVSRFYQTPCFPKGAGPDFVNAAATLAFQGEPDAVLRHLHEIEARFGRERVSRWGARTLDLDLLAVASRILPDEIVLKNWMELSPRRQLEEAPDQLILPHPRLHERGFVLVPMADVAPDWVHPILGRSVQQMLDGLPDAQKAEIQAI
ncbi:2-amino-4-hydroxy-6-hydroxymethyldihydropteridine diphosphokinase [Rhodovulum sp. FJ3]|uniref:2-amino-4-hydroxy-6- hydroxymethyldihydropteridine diphosphokinase n=1 Tax=Rhodovulum sp. FJ3 TaxID=3079053 RepID=UPI00293DB0CF|nr:2-amino-4-hydroxy-6-hydroxymethyldihydropteridine diphosphokinase [Rhodovulum sp. FJ3]MDV4168763.1 2-amino-4-hydroxy-6-hydroxymethyldihydropteridine diphosphokinase [Rhodovulum sp. FJ3]